MNAKTPIPPKWALAFLRWFCDPDLLEDIEGDLCELHAINFAQGRQANAIFIWDVIKLFRPGIVKTIKSQNSNYNAMFKNYLLTALRSALRYKGYTVLNILGLSVGITASLLILLWLSDEVQMDKFHTNGDKIYQLYRVMRQSDGAATTTESLPKPLADLISDTYSEVDVVASLSWPMEVDVQFDKKQIELPGRFASQSFLNLFSFQWLVGDRPTALQDLTGIVLAKSSAIALFGDNWQSAVGQSLRIEDQFDLKVTGIFEDFGRNSTIQVGWLVSAETFYTQNEWVEDWGNGSFGIFISIQDQSDVEQVRKRIYDEIKNHTADNPNAGDEVVVFQKFEDAYLNSKFENGVVVGGRIDYVYLLGIVAVLTILIACINFMNLATARTAGRSKEVGIRKAIGARPAAVGSQFYVESALTTAVAIIISVVLVLLLLPRFNELVGKELLIEYSQPATWIILLSFFIFVSFFSGSYPALLLSRFNVVSSLKGAIRPSSFTAVFRKGLVIFQFACSTLLIICSVVVYQQLNFALKQNLGLDKENVLAVRLNGDLSSRLEAYKEELAKIPEVESVTAASGNPLNYGRSTSSAVWQGKDPSEGYEINVILTDYSFVDVMGMEIVQGRAFSEQIQDSTNFLINEVAAELMGFEEPIDKELSFWGIDGKIIGVVKNFHMRDFYTPIAPLIISCYSTRNLSLALIRLNGDTRQAIEAIEATTLNLLPGETFEYEFLDQAVAASYQNEMVVRTLATILAGISIFISCLGLLGLASYSADRRSKEISVRKIQGASDSSIILLLSRDYSGLILVSFLLALPIAYLVANNWLGNFEYRIELQPLVFLLGALLVFVIGGATVLLRFMQAARSNPAEVLRNE